MSVFADSSAVVKLYANEQDHELIRPLAAISVSALARVEVPAALWRKHRTGELSAEAAGALTRAFEADFHGTSTRPPRFSAVSVLSSLLDDAAALAATHGLRAYDAVQLSTALAVRSADASCTTFACFDEELRRAAATTGFALLPT